MSAFWKKWASRLTKQRKQYPATRRPRQLLSLEELEPRIMLANVMLPPNAPQQAAVLFERLHGPANAGPSLASTKEAPEIFTVPGLRGQTTSVRFTVTGQDAGYRNELGIVLVDDASGRIGKFRPEDMGYAAAALRHGSRRVLFSGKPAVGQTAEVKLPAGRSFIFFFVQNGTANDFLAKNRDNQINRTPLVFFSITRANPDRVQHLREWPGKNFGFEDRTRGGDRDYNDLVVSMSYGKPKGQPAPPKLAARLSRDTAPGNTTNTDRLTWDPAVEGTLSGSKIVRFRAGFDAAPLASYANLLGQLRPNGTFSLDRGRIDQIAGGLLADGPHVLHLLAEDQRHKVAMFDLAFTLDTTAPVTFDLAPEFDSSPVGDRQTTFPTVTLRAQTEAGAVVILQETGATTRADVAGVSQFTGVTLNPGPNSFTLTATDRAGNSGTASRTITRTIDDLCGFDDLTDWTVVTSGGSDPNKGSVTLDGRDAVLREGNSLLVTLERTFTVPAEASRLKFIFAGPAFDTTDIDSINDAFEVALLDAGGAPLVFPFAPGHDAYFNISEGQPASLGTGTSVDGQTVTTELSGLTPGGTFRLVFRLANNDSDTETTVRIKCVEIVAGGSPPPVGILGSLASLRAPPALDFALLSDVSDSLAAEYFRTSFDEAERILDADLGLHNNGHYEVAGPLLAVVRNLSDPSVRVRDADGLTPDGLPYYDFTHLLDNGRLLPGATTPSKRIAFFSPNGAQFSYDLVFLGQLNRKPAFTTEADVEALAGRHYVYQASATDPDGDALAYSLVMGPAGMAIDRDSGQITWQPTTNDLGNYAAAIRVEDGRGGFDEQQFTLAVRDNVPNRPPVFTSVPVVGAHVNTLYTYQATADDADGDALTFALVSGPAGLAVDAVTGIVTWTPAAVQMGPRDVTLRVEDGHGGVATQTFAVRVLQEAGNAPPVIVSDPITQFSLPSLPNPATGQVSPTAIDLELVDGEVHTQTVSITLPAPPPPPPPSAPGQGSLTTTRQEDPALLAAALTAGSAGLVITDVRLQGQSAGIATTLPADGEYVLVVGNNPPVGAPPPINYTLRLDDRSDAPIAAEGFGLVQAGTIAAGEVKTFTYTAPAGLILYFDSQFSSGTTSVVMTDPYQGRVIGSGSSADLGPFVLPRSGTYTLTLSAAAGAPTLNYRFRVLSLAQSALDLNLGEVVSGTLTSARETVAYRFHGTPGQQVYFDGLDGDGESFGMSLVGPDHTTKYLTSSSGEGDAGPATLTQEGIYYLFLSGNQASGTPDYQFRLLDVASSPVLRLDEEVSDGLTPGTENDLYHFDGIAGQRLYFDFLAGVTTANWTLYGPGAQQIGGSGIPIADFEVTLPGTGRYTLVIDGFTATPVSYRFKVVTPEVTSTPLMLSALVMGTISEPGEQDEHTFTGSPGQRLYYDGLTPFSTRLVSPTGNNVFTGSQSNAGPVTLSEAGVYRLIVDPTGDAVGAYGFRLLDVADQPALPLDQEVSGTLDPGLTSHVFRLDGVAGQRLYFDSLQAGSGTWALYGTNNGSLASTNLGTDFEVMLPTAGPYTLVLAGASTTTPVPYRFRVVTAEVMTTPLTLNATVSGTIAEPGEQHEHTFTGSPGQRLYYDSLNSFDARLVSPTGATIFSRTGDEGPVTLTEAGAYRLVIDPFGETVGNYSFRLFDLADQPPLPLATTVSDSLNPGLASHLFRFTGAAGQRLSFDSLLSASNAIWTLYGPGNQNVGSASLGTDFTALLPADGLYALVLDGNSTTAPIGYSFRVTDVSDAPVAATGFDMIHSGAIAAGQVQTFDYTGSAGLLVYFDAQDNRAGSLLAELRDPTGTLVFSATAANDAGPFVLPRSGSYTLTVRGAFAGATGNFQFRLLAVADEAQPLAIGDTVTDTLALGLETAVYSFAGNSGQRLYFDALERDSDSVRVRLLSPSNTVVGLSDADSDSDVGPFTLTEAGTYYLFVKGTEAAGAADYAFRLLDAGSAPVLPLDSEVNDTLDPGLSSRLYRFEGAAGQRLFFDGLSSGTGNWALYGPANQRLFLTALGSDFEVTLPTAGPYTLVIEGNNATAPVPYRFRVVTPDIAATPLTLNATATGTISEPGGQGEHTFMGSPGQRLYYDALGSFNVSLVSPTGATVFSAAADAGPFTLTEAGAYRIVVDPTGATIGDYSFRLLDLAAAIPAALDTVVAGTLNPGLQVHLYQVSATAGQRLYFDALSTSSAIWALYGPRDQQIAFVAGLGDFEVNIPDTGVYTLAIRGVSATAPVDYRFQVVTPEIISAPLTLDAPTDVTIAEPGEQREFTFTGTAGQRLFYDVQVVGEPSFTVRLLSPSGASLGGMGIFPGPNETELITLTETGTHRLTFDGIGSFTGTFRFRLLDTTTQTLLPLNTDVSGRLDPRTAASVYRFEGRLGERVRFSNSGVIQAPNWALYGVGRLAVTSGILVDTMALSTGTFTNTSNVYNLPASGIVISTGDVPAYGSGPNNSPEASTFFNLTKPSLEQEAILDPITGPSDHYDVTQFDITFDTLPGFDEVFFTVVFGSEEYPEYVNSAFIDGFGLLLNGVNLATVGGLPVNINHPAMAAIPGTQLDGVLAPQGNPLVTFSARVGAGTKDNVLTFIVADTGDNAFDTTAYISSLSALPPGPLDLDMIASDPAAGFENRTGVVAGVQRGQPATFDARFTGDGAAHSFDLLFVKAGTGTILGSIPVTISNDYHYPAAAIDPDGDTLTWSLSEAPAGATIDIDTGKISWEPPGAGQYRFVVRVEDGRGGVDTQDYLVDVAVGAPNQPPTISSTAPTQATAGLPFTYAVAATDPDGDLPSYYLTNPPAGMTIERTTGVLSWTPTPAQLGPQAVTVRVLDGRGGSATQSFTVAVVPDTGNRAPRVTSAPVTLGVADQTYRYAAGATDADADPLQFDLVVRPDGMTVDPTTGVIVWQPGAEDIGSHHVFLRVQDGRGGVDLQTFEVRVTAGGTAPVITTRAPDAPAVVGRPFAYRIDAQDAENDALSFGLVAPPAGMTIDATGLITWTPAADQAGAHTITVAVDDGHGGVTTVALPLTVVADAPNTDPQITSTPRDRIGLAATYFYAVQAVDADNDPLTLTLETAPAGMTLDAGMITWSPSSGQLGEQAVAVRVEDGRGGAAVQSFTVTVESRNANLPPRILSSPVFTAFADGPYRYDVQGNDPEGDPLLWSLDQAPAGMSINPLLGTVRWTPTLEDVGTHEVVIRLFDAQGGTTTQAFTVMVEGSNRPPAIRSTPPTVAAVGEVYTYAVRASDPDGQPLSFALLAAPSGMSSGPTGEITWTPEATQIGTFDVVVRVSDGFGGTATQVYTVVSALPVNDPPVITSSPPVTAVAGTPYRYVVTATDPEGAALVFSLTNPPAGMTIDANTGEVTWTPSAGQAGTRRMTVLATDPGGAAATQAFNISVRGQNRAPVISSSLATMVTAGAPYRYDVRATDADGDRLTFGLTAGPQGMEVDALGRITWAPGAAQVGTRTVTVTVSDGIAPAVEQTFEILVQADTQGPRVTLSLATGRVSVGSSLTFVVNASDDVGVVSRQLTVGGVAVALDANGRATVPFPAVGVVEVVATARDAAGNTGQASASVIVFDPAVSGAPVVALNPLPDDGVITSFADIVGTAADPDLLFYVLEVRPLAGGAFREVARGAASVNNGILGRFDPTLLTNDIYLLRLTATDAGGNSASTQMQVSIAGDLKLGNFTLSFNDLTVPVSGIPISVTRTYDTLTANEEGEFGFGWRLEFRDTRLRTSVPKTGLEQDGIFNSFQDGSRVYITLPGGKREGFTFRPIRQTLFLSSYYVPAFVPDPGVTSSLSVPGAKRNVGMLAGIKDFFGANGALTLFKRGDEYVDSNGMPYNPADSFFGGIYEMTTRDGSGYKIDGMTGKLLSVADGNGNQVTFTDAGIRSSAGPEVRFERDLQGRITSVTDPMGNAVRYQYDARGDLVAVTDRLSNRTQFVYDTLRPHYLRDIIDPLGRTGVRSEYDAQGRLTRLIDASGNAVQVESDPTRSLEVRADALGNVTRYEYDARGNLVREIDAQGGITLRTYDAENRLLTETNPLGHSRSFSYDAVGNRVSSTDPLGNTTRFTYGAGNRVLTVTDPLGNTTSGTLDSRGNLLTRVEADGSRTTFVYDDAGSPTSITDALGGVTRLEYDGFGNVIRQIDALGHETRYSYDAIGNPLTETTRITTPQGVRDLVTVRTFDRDGYPISMTDPEGNTTRYTFDAQHRPTVKTDALGRNTQLRYDAQGQLIEAVSPDGTSVRFAYDAAGRRVSVTDQAGRTTYFLRDSLGQVIEIIYPDETPADLTDNPRSRTEYDAAGRVLAQVDENGRRTVFGYDAADREVMIRDPLGQEWTNSYDAVGRKIAQTDPLGRVTRFVFDARGRMVEQVFADGSSISNNYDALDRTLASTDQGGRTTHFQYDPLGQLTVVIDALGQRTEYGYDEAGNRIVQRDANGHATLFEYDGDGRLVATVRPLGQRASSAYDAVGNVVNRTDFNGDTIRYEYDALHRLVARRFPDGTAVEFTYTPTGQQETVRDERGVTAYLYDARGRLLRRTDPDGQTVAYAYDAVGNRTAVISLTGTTRYTFDELNRLTTVTANVGTIHYSYDPASNLVRTELPNGAVEIRTYDLLNRLMSIEDTDTSGSFSSFQYTLSPTGQRLSVVENSGRQVNYAYDELDRLVRESIIDPSTGNRVIEYTYDAVGNRLLRSDSVEGQTSYDYDGNDRLLTEQRAGMDVHFSYDANGNLLLTEAGPNDQTVYTWDFENRLHSVTETHAAITSQLQFRYDAEGNRVAQVVNGEETRFLVDSNREFAEVVEDYLPGGVIQTAYVHGIDLIAQVSNGQAAFYHMDGLGSTRALTNSAGQVTDFYAFDAFGRDLLSQGGTSNSYLYAGERFDSFDGQYYLRARYYAPESGRFLSTDPLAGNIYNPVTLQPYLYANANPVNNTDPSGQFTLIEIQIGIGIAAATVAAYVTYRFTEGMNPIARTFLIVAAAGIGFAAGFYLTGLIAGGAPASAGAVSAEEAMLQAELAISRQLAAGASRTAVTSAEEIAVSAGRQALRNMINKLPTQVAKRAFAKALKIAAEEWAEQGASIRIVQNSKYLLKAIADIARQFGV